MIAGAQFVEQLATSVTLPRATLAAPCLMTAGTLHVDTPEALPIELVSMRMPDLNRIVRAQVYRHDIVSVNLRPYDPVQMGIRIETSSIGSASGVSTCSARR